jgi:hypothetical protein
MSQRGQEETYHRAITALATQRTGAKRTLAASTSNELPQVVDAFALIGRTEEFFLFAKNQTCLS